MNETTVTFTDEISGILGLGFPRLSQIYHTAAHGNDLTPARSKKPLSEMVRRRHSVLFVLGARRDSGLPYIRYLSHHQLHRYSLPWSVCRQFRHDYERSYCPIGAIDSSVVGNLSSVEWHYVVPFAPEGASNNVSSYLFWTLQLSSISVSCNQHG